MPDQPLPERIHIEGGPSVIDVCLYDSSTGKIIVDCCIASVTIVASQGEPVTAAVVTERKRDDTVDDARLVWSYETSWCHVTFGKPESARARY